MEPAIKADLTVGLYILFAFLLTLFLVLIFPQESSLLSPNMPMRLPFLAGLLAFMGTRFPSASIGSVFVIMMIEPVMGTNVDRMTVEQSLWLNYYTIITFILLVGAFVGLVARGAMKEKSAA